MKQRLVNKSIKLSAEEIHYLNVLKEKYHVKINQFRRIAIVEKCKKDVHELRIKHKDKLCPF